MPLFSEDVKTGIVHPQRLEDPALEDRPEGHAFHAGDEKSQQVRRVSVTEIRPGLVNQRSWSQGNRI